MFTLSLSLSLSLTVYLSTKFNAGNHMCFRSYAISTRQLFGRWARVRGANLSGQNLYLIGLDFHFTIVALLDIHRLVK